MKNSDYTAVKNCKMDPLAGSKSQKGCYLCETLNYFNDGPDLYAPKMNRFHVNLNELNGKWYLMINGYPYSVKYCPNCGRKLDEWTTFEVKDSL